MKAIDLMSSPVFTCRADDSCEVPAGHMWNRDCGCVVVTNDDGTVAGIVTDRDLCMACWTTGRSLHSIPVRDVMSSPVRAVRDADPLMDIVATMAQEQVNRVPVIDEKGVLVGLISTADVLREHHKSGVSSAEVLTRTLWSISRSRNEAIPALPAPVVATPKAESVITLQPKVSETRPSVAAQPAVTQPAASQPAPQPTAVPKNTPPKGKPNNPPRKN